MRGFLARVLYSSLILYGLAPQAWAQTTTQGYVRGAYFVAAPEPRVPKPRLAQAPAPAKPSPPPVVIEAVAVATLPKVSSESVGLKDSESFGADMWKGTSRGLAERLLSQLAPTTSPVLNQLAMRLLKTAAAPPEGGDASPRFTSLRIEKLAAFGDAAGAWALAKQADSKLVDDATFRLAAENAALGGDDNVCAHAPEYAKAHPGKGWQTFMIVCRFRVKDHNAAQVALDILRTEDNHDVAFVHVADRNILGASKTLPSQLTPVTLETVALLQVANLPLPDAFFARQDYSGVRSFVRLPAQKDAARLALAEKAAERGLIGGEDLAAAYRLSTFSEDAMASPLGAHETGVRLRALLFRAAEGIRDPGAKIAVAKKFMESAPPALLNGAGGILASMLGDVEADSSMAKDAATLARIYMLADNEEAQDWYELAQSASPAEVYALWPQFALADMEEERTYAASFAKWFNPAVKAADSQTVRDVIVPTLLILDAAGLKVPEAAWDTVLAVPQTAKKIAMSPLVFERMLAGAGTHKRAETILMASLLAADGQPSLTATLGIISALRETGFEKEAALYARHAVAALAREN
jgi:hypothetical protein